MQTDVAGVGSAFNSKVHERYIQILPLNDKAKFRKNMQTFKQFIGVNRICFNDIYYVLHDL